MDDNQWEPDEEFFVKLTILQGDEFDIKLGRTSIMEITILNDDGKRDLTGPYLFSAQKTPDLNIYYLLL